MVVVVVLPSSSPRKSNGTPVVEVSSMVDSCPKEIGLLANLREEPRKSITSPKVGWDDFGGGDCVSSSGLESKISASSGSRLLNLVRSEERRVGKECRS